MHLYDGILALAHVLDVTEQKHVSLAQYLDKVVVGTVGMRRLSNCVGICRSILRLIHK